MHINFIAICRKGLSCFSLFISELITTPFYIFYRACVSSDSFQIDQSNTLIIYIVKANFLKNSNQSLCVHFSVFLFQMKLFSVVGGSTPRLMLLLGKLTFRSFFNIFLFLPGVRCKYKVRISSLWMTGRLPIKHCHLPSINLDRFPTYFSSALKNRLSLTPLKGNRLYTPGRFISLYGHYNITVWRGVFLWHHWLNVAPHPGWHACHL